MSEPAAHPPSPLKPSPYIDRFSGVSIAFHWVVGVLILCVIAIAFYMEDLPNSSYKYQVYNLHKSLGLLVLIFAIPRLLWRFGYGRPPKLATYKPWEQALSSIVAWAMYGLIFALPLSGWLMNSAYGFPLKMFGVIDIPALMTRDPELAQTLKMAHYRMGDTLKILIVLHVAGTLKHFMLDKDNTLYRMLPLRILKKD